MKKVLFVLLIALVSSTPVYANVFAFNISVDTSGTPVKISYRLNDNASAVQIQIFGPLPATTVIGTISGTTNKGSNTVNWDGAGTVAGNNYGFKITAQQTTGYADWTRLNDSSTIFQFYTPRGGVSVNKNVRSPYFGMIYTANSFPGTTTAGGRAMDKGLFALYPDGTDPLSLGNTARAGGITWDAVSSNSPYHVFVAPDDRVYICDWADAHSGLWRAEPNLSGNFTEIFDNTGRVASGLVGTLHGSIAGVWVEGTGASTIVYTYDEDLPPAPSVTAEPGLRNIYKYAIGNGPFPWTTNPTVQIDERDFSAFSLYNPTYGLFVNDTNGGLKRDSAGNWYVSNYRAVFDSPCLMKFASDGKTLLWDSITNGTSGATEEFLYDLGGFAIDEAHNRIAVAINTLGFKVFPFNPLPSGDLVSKITTVTIPTGTSNRGIDFDAAGNVYLINSTDELLYIYSPPGTNSYITETNLTLPGGAAMAADSKWSIYE